MMSQLVLVVVFVVFLINEKQKITVDSNILVRMNKEICQGKSTSIPWSDMVIDVNIFKVPWINTKTEYRLLIKMCKLIF